MRIGIIAALPGELKPLVRGWRRQPSGVKGISVWTTTRDGDELIAVAGGMGEGAATRSVAAAEFLGTLEMLVSVGWVGALDDVVRPGECYIPTEIIDAQTGERFLLADGDRRLRLVTTVRVAGDREKQRLRASYGAAMVDMEAAAVARLAQMREIPVICFKAVSDAKDAKLPDLNAFIDAQGQMQMVPFLAHVALRPQLWGSLLALGRNSSAGARAIAETLSRFFVEKDMAKANRTGTV
jgi:adenosylhomocysteine nucleosidase